MIIFVILIIFLFMYLLSINPNRNRKDQMNAFTNTYIAHRGLFDNSSDAPENSIPAFRKAVEHHYGIELDVHLTADGKLVVFHDDSLQRMCHKDKNIFECSYDELQQFTLAESCQRIPLLTDVLKIVTPETPLIIEIKHAGGYKPTVIALDNIMSYYKGIYCIESFHPMALAWYKKHHPEIIRGQLATNFFHSSVAMNIPGKIIFSNLLCNFYTKPDFIAYNHKYFDQISFRLCRKLFHPVTAAWTIKNEKQLKKAKSYFDIFIFDSFTP